MNNARRKLLATTIIFAGITGLLPGAGMATSPASRAAIETHAMPYQPVIISGGQLQELVGTDVRRIGLFAVQDHHLTPIPFQIDRRDAAGRYLLDDTASARVSELGSHDEIVFMYADTGALLDGETGYDDALAGFPVSVHGEHGTRWAYALVFAEPHAHHSDRRYIEYNADTDTIDSQVYRLGFAPDKPFLVDRFHWRDRSGGWKSNLADTMKVRHIGKLFGLVDFKRTQADYTSSLVAVQRGPVRIIRRTRNSVYMLLGLSTPALYIDHVATNNSVVMDTTIDLPFSMGLFFADLITLTTMDWNEAQATDGLRLLFDNRSREVAVDGWMSAAENSLTSAENTDYVVAHRDGEIRVSIDLDRELPVAAQVYLVDDRTAADPPENESGQFGNSGYLTTGWEHVGRGIHHMRFSFTLVPNFSNRQYTGLH